MRPHLVFPTALALVLGTSTANSQYAERPDPVGVSGAVDCSGRSIKNQRTRAVHTTDPFLPGGTADLIQNDPFLAYQLGRNLCFREFRSRDGVFDQSIAGLGGTNPDGLSFKITARNQVSCSGCHNLPQGNPGGGVTFHKDSGHGRNTPHYYGAGIMEMLALQVRAELLFQVDTDGNGWVDAAEAAAAPGNLFAVPSPSAPPLDYGDPRLTGGDTGSPTLNNILRVWYVDQQGRVVDGATGVDGIQTFGYNFALIVWGWGQGPGRSALNPTNRVFVWDPFAAHSGLEAHDPSTLNDPDGDGVSLPTLAGAVQFPATHRAPDAGRRTARAGYSRDDPDGDGHLTEISEGDLDLAEWFLLHTPRPAFAGSPAQYSAGVAVLDQLQCTGCHVARWDIRAQDGVFDGDRRLFDLDVRFDPLDQRLEGRLVPLYTRQGPAYVANRDGFPVLGVFTDLRHHDMGSESEEIDFGGTVNQVWRTPPLWGVGSGFPWHHDGRSLTLEDSILRHGGEAAASRDLYVAASPATRRLVEDFLRRLVLYDIESLPADVNGDGVIQADYPVAGVGTGVERFNAEWLFRVPLEIQGWLTNMHGVPVLSFAGLNVPDAYAETLAYRRDSDSDGWPDVWDRAPQHAGYRDGVK